MNELAVSAGLIVTWIMYVLLTDRKSQREDRYYSREVGKIYEAMQDMNNKDDEELLKSFPQWKVSGRKHNKVDGKTI